MWNTGIYFTDKSTLIHTYLYNNMISFSFLPTFYNLLFWKLLFFLLLKITCYNLYVSKKGCNFMSMLMIDNISQFLKKVIEGGKKWKRNHIIIQIGVWLEKLNMLCDYNQLYLCLNVKSVYINYNGILAGIVVTVYICIDECKGWCMGRFAEQCDGKLFYLWRKI
jgi:hypothetical protein